MLKAEKHVNDRAVERLGFIAEVEGVTYKIDLMTTPEEAYASVGMKPPE